MKETTKQDNVKKDKAKVITTEMFIAQLIGGKLENYKVHR